nr:bifunctional aspartate transaminase/aspartate 4-decarboxylase [uncultured Rhodopila sp.]
MAISKEQLAEYSKLSPFEVKDALIRLASRVSDRLMLNAGRGNPNFMATVPRHGFFQLGAFAMAEAERGFAHVPGGVGETPRRDGIENRFHTFTEINAGSPGIDFLRQCLSYVHDRMGIDSGDFLYEMVFNILGCNYPTPDRMLRITETICKAYVIKSMCNGKPFSGGDFDLFAAEGSAAGIPYVFNSLMENKILKFGDKIAVALPIFTPYIEMPPLNDYQLVSVYLNADEDSGWQYSDAELDKLLDPNIKAFFLNNPSNPPSVKMDNRSLERIADIVNTRRRDLVILTDDVYGTFADDFVSLFQICPRNTILAYSYSKYFGATGWRMGVVGLAHENIIDETIAALPASDKAAIARRYATLAVDPSGIKFIDRVVADSRAVALNHVAGLSTVTQVQMALFSLFSLIDEHDIYQTAMKDLIRNRHTALYAGLKMDVPKDPNGVYYYSVIDLLELSTRLHGKDFADWVQANHPGEFIFRLAEETGVVLMPAKGFGVVHPSSRVSLANLNHNDYAAIGRATRKILDEYYADFARSK